LEGGKAEIRVAPPLRPHQEIHKAQLAAS